jgi:branched-chain amino acid transport system permease protein
MGLTPMSVDVTMLVIGGLGTVTGPLVGTALLAIVQTALVTHPGVELTILGTFLLLVVVFAPGGLVGLTSRYWRRLAAWAAEGDEDGKTEPVGTAADDAASLGGREGSARNHVA